MRILYVTKTPPSSSGIARYAVNFAETLRELGDLEKISSGHEAGDTRRIAAAVQLARRVRRAVKSTGPDLIFFELSGGCIAETLAALAVVVSRRRPAVVVNVHDPPVLTGGLFLYLGLDRRGCRRVADWLSRHLGRYLERTLLMRADLVLTLSQVGARSLGAHFELDRAVEHIPPVVAIRPHTRAGVVVFFPAPISPVTVIPGLQVVAKRRDRVQGVLIGNGSHDELSRVASAVDELGLTDVVTFTGVLDQEGLDQAYTDSSIVVRVIPADDVRWDYANTDAASGPVFDALGAGAVMVTNAARSTVEYLTDDVDAMVLPARETHYEARLAGLLDDPVRLHEMQAAAASYAATHLAPGVIAKRFVDLLTAVTPALRQSEL